MNPAQLKLLELMTRSSELAMNNKHSIYIYVTRGYTGGAPMMARPSVQQDIRCVVVPEYLGSIWHACLLNSVSLLKSCHLKSQVKSFFFLVLK